MIIILEGIDKTGKSTLSQHLNELLGSSADVRHATRPLVHPLEEYELSLASYEPGTTTHVILDRWHVGERVWPEVYGRSSEYDEVMHRHVELFLVSRGAFLILAEGREEAVHGRLDDTDDITQHQISEILRMFKEVVKESLIERTSYDLERDDMEIFSWQTLKLASALDAEVTRVHDLSPRWVGYPHPHTLYVGHRGDEMSFGLPMVPYKGTAGWALLHAIMNSHLSTSPIAITNALKPDGTQEDVRGLWSAMNRPRVVALGDDAHTALESSVPHGVASDPLQVYNESPAALEDGRYVLNLTSAMYGVDTRGDYA